MNFSKYFIGIITLFSLNLWGMESSYEQIQQGLLASIISEKHIRKTRATDPAIHLMEGAIPPMRALSDPMLSQQQSQQIAALMRLFSAQCEQRRPLSNLLIWGPNKNQKPKIARWFALKSAASYMLINSRQLDQVCHTSEQMRQLLGRLCEYAKSEAEHCIIIFEEAQNESLEKIVQELRTLIEKFPMIMVIIVARGEDRPLFFEQFQERSCNALYVANPTYEDIMALIDRLANNQNILFESHLRQSLAHRMAESHFDIQTVQLFIERVFAQTGEKQLTKVTEVVINQQFEKLAKTYQAVFKN